MRCTNSCIEFYQTLPSVEFGEGSCYTRLTPPHL